MKVKEVDIKEEWDDGNDDTQMLKMHITWG